jgi:4-amino-4-deoxy-L-arabinose transferase-like glycosyltransferase
MRATATFTSRADGIAVCAMLVVLALGFQGARPLWDPDEGRYSDIALQMVDSGDWWLPRLNDEQPHLAKPPLTYWMIAASVSMFGRSAWAVRLPNALAFILTGLLVADIARSLGFRRPWVATGVWATSIGPFVASQFATPDALLAVFSTAAVATFLRAGGLAGVRLARRWTILMWVSLALGFMTKGPPALISLLLIVVWLAATRRHAVLRQVFDSAGLLLFVALGGSWFASMVAQTPDLADYFLRYEFVDRLFSGVHDRNPSWTGAVKVYVPTLVVGAMPWLPLLLSRRSGNGETAQVADPTSRFLWLWMAVPLVIFALARSRLPLYILPLFVPLSLILALRLPEPVLAAHRAGVVLLCAWITALLVLKWGASRWPTDLDARETSVEILAMIPRMSQPTDEIVFLRRPAYGTRFYTGLPVERVQLEAGHTWYGEVFAMPSVCEEVLEPEHPLWVVPSGMVRQFSRQLEHCGFASREIGTGKHDRRFFEVSRPHAAQAHQDPVRIRR